MQRLITFTYDISVPMFTFITHTTYSQIKNQKCQKICALSLLPSRPSIYLKKTMTLEQNIKISTLSDSKRLLWNLYSSSNILPPLAIFYLLFITTLVYLPLISQQLHLLLSQPYPFAYNKIPNILSEHQEFTKSWRCSSCEEHLRFRSPCHLPFRILYRSFGLP